MDLNGWLKKLTTGRVVFATSSPINGEIQVVEDIFGKRLVVEGLTQSGGQVERIWKKAIKEIGNHEAEQSSLHGHEPTKGLVQGWELKIGNLKLR